MESIRESLQIPKLKLTEILPENGSEESANTTTSSQPDSAQYRFVFLP